MADKIEAMCSKCGFRQERKLGTGHAYKYCPHDTEPLLNIWLEDRGEIILQKTSDDMYDGIGIHFRCGGIVKDHNSSEDKLVYACGKCFWRYKSLE